jgi:hypothetical protein
MRILLWLLAAASVGIAVAACIAGHAIASPVTALRPDGGDGFTVSLAASAPVRTAGQSVTLTATASADVGPTPYWISIYDLTSQTELMSCGTGTTCLVTVTADSGGTQDYQAYVGDLPAAQSKPGFILASSQIVGVTWYPRPVCLPEGPCRLGG